MPPPSYSEPDSARVQIANGLLSQLSCILDADIPDYYLHPLLLLPCNPKETTEFKDHDVHLTKLHIQLSDAVLCPPLFTLLV